MPIKIYNSLTRKKEEFKPLKADTVNMYTCGVTVYDECHIGHARSLYIFDVIVRYLRYRGFKVNFVRNITDIDDKIINRAKEQNVPWDALSKRYIESYYQDLNSLGVGKADFEPKATENIKEMIEYIKTLIEKGLAYPVNGSVYFRVRNFKDYGKLSGQGIDQMMQGVRIDPDEKKEDPLDFALWKKSKEDEPFWPSPWGNGRPGWHIECSVMSQKYLKTDTLDIHGGGRDLIFPHHENEIAQSESLTGKPFANYWIHHGLLTINAQKMSKSLGNFVTIKDFVVKYNNPDLLKFLFLSTHYAHPVDYNEDKIAEAKKAFERIFILIRTIERKLSVLNDKLINKKVREVEEIKNDFINAMDDDFNTPQGLASIFELVNITNKNIDNLDFIFNAKNILKDLLNILGIELLERLEGVDLDAVQEIWIKLKIEERIQLKKVKNFIDADRIRKELEEKGIILEDTKEGTTWRRKI